MFVKLLIGLPLFFLAFLFHLFVSLFFHVSQHALTCVFNVFFPAVRSFSLVRKYAKASITAATVSLRITLGSAAWELTHCNLFLLWFRPLASIKPLFRNWALKAERFSNHRRGPLLWTAHEFVHRKQAFKDVPSMTTSTLFKHSSVITLATSTPTHAHTLPRTPYSVLIATPKTQALLLSPSTPLPPLTPQSPTLVNDEDFSINKRSSTSLFIRNSNPKDDLSQGLLVATERCAYSHNNDNSSAPSTDDPFIAALDMDLIPIGEGAFGQVFRATGLGGRALAIKIMQKDSPVQELAIMNEVNALRMSQGCRWAVGLEYFHDMEEQALIALTYIPGGDMYAYWERAGFCLPLATAKFYTAQLILAIHALHTRGILHRDIKLENIMLDDHHNIKLVDFGLAQLFDHDGVSKRDYPLFHQAKKAGGDAFPLLWATSHNPHQTDLVNGTEGYAPPEVWGCHSHSFGIDYFAMGCVLHVMLTGSAPFWFNPVTQDYDYNRILVIKKNMTPDVVDFLSKVLAPRPVNRLNVRRMKLHPIFYGIDWSALATGRVKPPVPRRCAV